MQDTHYAHGVFYTLFICHYKGVTVVEGGDSPALLCSGGASPAEPPQLWIPDIRRMLELLD